MKFNGDESLAGVKADVLRRVIVLDAIGRRLTIPALVQEMIDDMGGDDSGVALECAVRDLDCEGLVSCRKGRIFPTADGFQINGESPTPCGEPVAPAVLRGGPRAPRGALIDPP